MAAAEFMSEVWQKREVGEKDVTWKEVVAEPHLERITRKYQEANMQKEPGQSVCCERFRDS